MGEVINKYVINNKPFWFLTIISVVLLIAGFLVPPVGIIDGSVLMATGEISGIMAIWTVVLAIERGKTVSLQHGQTSVEVRKEDADNQYIEENNESIDEEDQY